MASDGRKLNQIASDEHDKTEYRKRVQMYTDGNSVSYEDTSFVTGDSPAVLAVHTDLGRQASKGYFINDGPGNILIELSRDGTTYGGQHTLKGGEIMDLDNFSINKIRLTWAQNTSYRALLIG